MKFFHHNSLIPTPITTVIIHGSYGSAKYKRKVGADIYALERHTVTLQYIEIVQPAGNLNI